MRSSKSRSRSKPNRPRPIGNIVNRVFESSGPDGKVRGTPQQIIEKYLVLARDAQLANDRVAAEAFLQHAEHYTRMLGEALRELQREQDERQQQGGGRFRDEAGQSGAPDRDRIQERGQQERGQGERQQQDRGRDDRQPQHDRGPSERPQTDRSQPDRDQRGQQERGQQERAAQDRGQQGGRPPRDDHQRRREPPAAAVIEFDDQDVSGLVETPETADRFAASGAPAAPAPVPSAPIAERRVRAQPAPRREPAAPALLPDPQPVAQPAPAAETPASTAPEPPAAAAKAPALRRRSYTRRPKAEGAAPAGGGEAQAPAAE